MPLPPGVVSLQKISRETTKTRKNVVSLPFSSRETTQQNSGGYSSDILWGKCGANQRLATIELLEARSAERQGVWGVRPTVPWGCRGIVVGTSLIRLCVV